MSERVAFADNWERLADSMTWEEMAEQLGVGVTGLKQRAKRNGVEVLTSSQAFIEDYRFLRALGESHERIAERMGIQQESLMQRLSRLGVYVPDAEELRTLAVLDRLIDSGEPFTVDHLPGDYPHVVERAVGAGRAVCVGSRIGLFSGKPIGVYRRVA
jgi:hypothetical protein